MALSNDEIIDLRAALSVVASLREASRKVPAVQKRTGKLIDLGLCRLASTPLTDGEFHLVLTDAGRVACR